MPHYRYRKSWLWWRDGGDLYFGVAPSRALRVRGAPEWSDALIGFLAHPKTLEEAVENLAGHPLRPTREEIAGLLDELVAAGPVEVGLSEKGGRPLPARYQRLLSFWELWLPGEASPRQAQERLAGAHVLILGCGGIGTHLAQELAATGIGKLTLVDHDVIEASNLNRQILYGPPDLGRPKVEVAAERIATFNPEIIVQTIRRRIDSAEALGEILQDVDLLVQTADEPVLELPLLVNRAALMARVPWINSGTVESLVEVGPLVLPGSRGCYRCWLTEERAPDTRHALETLRAGSAPLRDYPRPSFSPLFALAASLLVTEVTKLLLLGTGPWLSFHSRVFRMDLWSMESWWIDIPPSPGCPDCEQDAGR